MTKYVLGGGEIPGLVDNEFFSTLTNINKDPLNVLLVYFAREPFKWLNLMTEDVNHFLTNSEKHLEFKIASFENFIEEITWADVIFFKGGDGPLLTEKLSQFPDLEKKLTNKSIGAMSAGVNALSQSYYSRRGQKVFNGVGVLKAKVFTHYEEDLELELHDLEIWGEDLEVITIPEGEHLVIEYD